MRNIRPSWVSLRIDGRASKVVAGPRLRTGSMMAAFFVHSKGRSEQCITVYMDADELGTRVRVCVIVEQEDGYVERVFDKEYAQ